MRPPVRNGGLAFLAAFVLTLLIPAISLADAPLSIEADRLELSADGRIIRADGRVALTYQDIILHADAVVYDGTMVVATGQVELTSASGHLFAERLNLALSTGLLSGTSIQGHYHGLIIKAERLEAGAKNEEALHGAAITRCDLETPCYELRASKITISGRKVSLEHGWLVLKGVRLIPLPRITLDLDRLEDWPKLSAGLGPHGLALGAELTMPLGESTGFAVKGEADTGGLLSLRPTFVWRLSPTATIAPWVSYSTREGYMAGIDASLTAGAATIAFTSHRDWLRDLAADELSLTVPVLRFANSRLMLEGFRRTAESPTDGDLTEVGAAVGWSQHGSEDAYSLTLVLGRAWHGDSSASVIRIEAEITEKINANWGWETEISYDAVDGAWRKGEIGIKRYLHCYFFRLSYDWTDASMDFSGGITF